MIRLGKKNVLGILVDAVDYEAAVDTIMRAAASAEAFPVTALAVHGVMTGVLDRGQAYRLNAMALTVPDGQPVRWALNSLHSLNLKDRVYGPNLMLKVCEQCARLGLPVYFYGSRQEVLQRLMKTLVNQFPGLKVAGAEASKFRTVSESENTVILQRIKDSGAKIVFVGLGCPRQEVWAFENAGYLSMPVLAVGAAFDFHAGSLPQAPRWMQSSGLEWLFRLTQEPLRLWKRYLWLNPAYLLLWGCQRAGWMRFDPAKAAAPVAPVRYA